MVEISIPLWGLIVIFIIIVLPTLFLILSLLIYHINRNHEVKTADKIITLFKNAKDKEKEKDN